jgi:hypothetical protein
LYVERGHRRGRPGINISPYGVLVVERGHRWGRPGMNIRPYGVLWRSTIL